MDYYSFRTVISCIFVIIIYSVLMWVYLSNPSTENRIILNVLFICYMIGFVYLTFLNRNGERIVFRLNPFGVIYKEINNGDFPYETLLNILLCIPLGMMLPFLTNRNVSYKYAAIFGVSVSFCTELLQLITRLGEFETKDLITNTIGTIIGLVIYNKILNR